MSARVENALPIGDNETCSIMYVEDEVYVGFICGKQNRSTECDTGSRIKDVENPPDSASNQID